jgi:transcriptional regulator with XRE-family HTH domain
MDPVRTLREQAGLTQQSLARAGGTSQPTIAAYEAGRKSPTVDTLQRLARAVGLCATIEYARPLTREDRRSLALHRAIARRLADDPPAVIAQARRNLARMRGRGPEATQLLREWDVILDRPVPALLAVLTDPGEWARELRHVTPFAGVLSAAERAAAYRAFATGDRASA